MLGGSAPGEKRKEETTTLTLRTTACFQCIVLLLLVASRTLVRSSPLTLIAHRKLLPLEELLYKASKRARPGYQSERVK